VVSSPLLALSLGVAIVAAVTANRARRLVAGPGELELRYSTRARIAGVVLTAGIAAWAAFGPIFEIAPADQLLGSLVGFVTVFMLGWLAIEFVGHKVILGPSAIIALSPWTGRRSARWSDIESVVYSENWQDFSVKSRSGAKLSVSQYLSGLDAFLHRVDGLGLTISIDPLFKHRRSDR
jgi:hypothetical protein